MLQICAIPLRTGQPMSLCRMSSLRCIHVSTEAGAEAVQLLPPLPVSRPVAVVNSKTLRHQPLTTLMTGAGTTWRTSARSTRWHLTTPIPASSPCSPAPRQSQVLHTRRLAHPVASAPCPECPPCSPHLRPAMFEAHFRVRCMKTHHANLAQLFAPHTCPSSVCISERMRM